MATQGKYNFDHVPVAPGPRKPISDGIAVGTLRAPMRRFEKRRCPKCMKINYDFMECVECGTDLSNEDLL